MVNKREVVESSYGGGGGGEVVKNSYDNKLSGDDRNYPKLVEFHFQ